MAQRGSGAKASTTPTIWIPVDGSLTLGEDYTETPKKSAGVAKANELLKKANTSRRWILSNWLTSTLVS